MDILISNDDGIYAPGIQILARELAKVFTIKVMAPERNQSGSSNALTLLQPLRVKKLDNDYYSVDGTPTDCVHLALTGFFEDPIDVVVSGINDGGNLGDDILYSGTVAAAMEGRNLGFPALAISMVGHSIQHYDTAAIITCRMLEQMKNATWPGKVVFNINVPDVPLAQIKGIQVTRLGTRHAAEPVVKTQDPRGRDIYWVGPPGPEADAGPGTDFHAISQGYVSITPLQLDMTHYKAFDHVSNWFKEFEWVS